MTNRSSFGSLVFPSQRVSNLPPNGLVLFSKNGSDGPSGVNCIEDNSTLYISRPRIFLKQFVGKFDWFSFDGASIKVPVDCLVSDLFWSPDNRQNVNP